METLAVKTPGRGNLDPARNVMAWALAPQPEAVNLAAKLQAAESLKPVHQGLHTPRVATVRVLPNGIGGHRIAAIVPVKLSHMSAANTG
jgi:hypothetical protein